MRALIGLLVCGLVACGGAEKKKAEDPASTSSSSASDETPKWDSSSESADDARRSKDLSSTAKRDTSSTSSEPAAAPAGPPPKQRRSDEYDKEATEVVLKRAARQVKANCGAATDDDGKQSGPWGSGSMKLVLGRNGHLKEAAIGPPFEGKATGRCAVQAFSRLTYPPWAGSDMTLDWPIEIEPPGKAAAPEKKK
jgi:hypothetical protein